MLIDTRLLNSFVCVAEELHFGRAAERLHIAQPALTRQIQQIEGRLGVTLFRRTQRSVALTPAGRILLERAYKILSDLHQAALEVKRVEAGQEGRLAVGFIHSSTYGITPILLRNFRHLYPRVALELYEMTIQEQIEALRAGTIDVGILRPPISDPTLQTQFLREEKFILAIPQKHPLASAKGVQLRQLSEDGFILFTQRLSPLFYSRIISMCERAGFVPKVAQYATQIHTLIGLVSAEMGVAIVPEVARNLNIPGVIFLEIADHPPSVDILLGWRASEISPVLKSFCDLASHCPEI